MNGIRRLGPPATRRLSREAQVLTILALTILATPASAEIDVVKTEGFTNLGNDVASKPNGGFDAKVDFRTRGAANINFDLDRGLDPNGAPLYPVPNDGTGQILSGADFRLRTDLAAYAPFADAAVKLRVDWIDINAGSTPDGPSQSVVTQRPISAIAIRRAYLETLTPFGLLVLGRVGAHWGTGMLANGGDCVDCNSGDAADRVAFITPIAGHVWAASYDLGFVGAQQRDDRKIVDIDPTDDVRSVTIATMRYRSPRDVQRRRVAGVSTIDYGLSFSHRWQKNDSPGNYIDGFDEDVQVPRGLTANLVSGYVSLHFPGATIRSEAAFLSAHIVEPSIIPGVRYDRPLTSTQWGGVLESSFGQPTWPVTFGLDAGVASGDGAFGFGARDTTLDPIPIRGELDGPQANPPFDNEVNNFRFHPDYHVDQILFREIIGRVTDAVYVRPHTEFKIARAGRNSLDAQLAAIASFAINETSTPNQQRALGFEIDPSLFYRNGHFSAALHYGVFVPGAAFDNDEAGLAAKPAQLLKTVIAARF